MATTHTRPEPPSGSRQLILNLRIDFGNQVRPLAVRPDDRALAIDCVRQLLLEPDKRRGHNAVVAEVFPNPPGAVDPLGAERAVAVVHDGPQELGDDELARVLLSRRAVADLTRLVHELLPDWWLNEMEAIGQHLASDTGIDLRPIPLDTEKPSRLEELELAAAFDGRHDTGVPAVTSHGVGATLEQTGPAVWTVGFTGPGAEAMKRKIATVAFGNPDASFTLRLHRVGKSRTELEMTPPPLKADVTLPARFRTGEERMFVVEVPAEAKVPGLAPSEIRPSTRSNPCEPLAAGALEIQELVVCDEGGMPLLWMRSGVPIFAWARQPSA
jgi:hypothetical protein